MSNHNYLAFDLGAGSGRSILGTLSDGRLSIKEITRFYNDVVPLMGRSHWDILRLFNEMKNSLETCALKEKLTFDSIGIDTWGVDFGLFGSHGELLGNPYAYRDSHTDGAMEHFFALMPRERVYQATGIQFMQFNTLFQLLALKRSNNPLLGITKNLLFIPDMLNYFFTGVMKSEFTFATTSQLYNPVKREWEKELFDVLGLPIEWMQEVVMPGTRLGNLLPRICEETGVKPVPVVAVASHDTGSAIASVPAEGKNWAYLSSGTWSLMGIEVPEPIINEKSSEFNFTNEGGVDGTIRFLKNITGLFLLEQCKRSWAICKDYSYEDLVEMAKSVEPFQRFIHVDDHMFLNPVDMPDAIREYCLKTGQIAPGSHSEYARCIFDSLALRYRGVLEELRQVSPHPIEKIHVIGGGSKNKFLCQLTADATGIPVVAGPGEATAIGNLMVQALAMGQVRSLAEIREVVRRSFALETYSPSKSSDWEAAFAKYKKIVN